MAGESTPDGGRPAPAREEARETASTTTGLVVNYVRIHRGERCVGELLSRAGVPFTAEELEDPARWFSYDTRIRLFEAATEVFDDPATPFLIGATALESNLPPAIVLLIRAIGSPRQVFRQLPSAVTKFSTTSTMEMLETGAGHATIRYRLHEGYRHSRLDCQYAQGLISTVPSMFSLPPARIAHPRCESDGHEACVYHVTWQRRPRLGRWSRRQRGEDPEYRALRGQLTALQSAASDLVGSQAIEDTLARITERAAAAVVAPAYLLAVHGPDGGPPLVHSSGLDAATEQAWAGTLLEGGDLGPHAVTVDVATARRFHGRLAALYDPQQYGLADEAELLSAYAAHAAAALEMLFSLEASRREEARARHLLGLAHRLAETDRELEVAEAVVELAPTILDVPRASVLAWDPGQGRLRGLAAHGLDPAQRTALFETGLRPDDTPELARMLTRHEPTLLEASSASEGLRLLLAAVDTDAVMAMPLLAGETLLGVLTVSHGLPSPEGWPDREAYERLQGIAEQAAAAMQNARLLAQIRHQVHHDSLTSLPNRLLFMQELTRRVASPEEEPDAVLFCDLDGFKRVNDTLGHAAGDELLRQVSARLRSVLRGEDLVARLSGDEFALLVSGPGAGGVADEVADRIIDEFSAPFRIDGRELRISASVGVAVRRDGEHGDDVLRRADVAMYSAKERRRTQAVAAGRPARASAVDRSSGEELLAAIHEGAFELHYQPIVVIDPTGTPPVAEGVIGQEALARWRHPRRGLLTPAAFLPDALETGTVVDLDLWALRTALAARATWTDHDQPPRVAVNLSAQTLVDRRLPGEVRAALVASDLEPASLTLEITESRSLADLPGVVEQLTELRRLGVRVSLDDFGTGYSTLTWLQRLPIDEIKLDRSFVADLGAGPRSGHLIEGVLALARALEVEVVAEGVETEEQLARLGAAGCRTVQGFLFSRPTPVPNGVAALLCAADTPSEG